MKISVIIKTLDEERNIARAIESALRAVTPFGGEVVVADCMSSDRTVEIAMQYPVKVVQLAVPSERCCGIAPQLGYQHSSGEYVYILDGDMDLDAKFIRDAIDLLDRDSNLAGVGGFIQEVRAENLQFRGRMKRVLEHRAMEPRDATCLSGGGLYRRASIESVGWFSDRNLRAYEEYDLGVRLRLAGWRLVHLPSRAADHYSYALSTMGLLWHKLRSGAYASQGQIVRAAIENGYVDKAFGEIFALRLSSAIWLGWLGVLFALAISGEPIIVVGITILGLSSAISIIAIRHKSLLYGLFSLLNWHLLAFNIVPGILATRTSPLEIVSSRVLKDPVLACSTDPDRQLRAALR